MTCRRGADEPPLMGELFLLHSPDLAQPEGYLMWWKNSHAELHGMATPAGFILAEGDSKEGLFSKTDFFHVQIEQEQRKPKKKHYIKKYLRKGNMKNVAFVHTHF